MLCNGKHIKTTIPEKDWICPKCGAGSESYAVWDSKYPPECEGEHPDDWAECMECGYRATLATITRNYWKNKNVTWVKCSHCKGTGLVRGLKMNRYNHANESAESKITPGAILPSSESAEELARKWAHIINMNLSAVFQEEGEVPSSRFEEVIKDDLLKMTAAILGEGKA